MSLFNEAPETQRAGILIHDPSEDYWRAVVNQRQVPLCFLSGIRKTSSSNWSVPKKNVFAIVGAMCPLDCLGGGLTVSMFTDHENLLYLSDPCGKESRLSRHTASKLMRWTVKLRAFLYVIDDMRRENNIWAGTLIRWKVTSPTTMRAKGIALKALVGPITPSLNKKLDRPYKYDIAHAQTKSKRKPRKRFIKHESCWKNSASTIWIPENN